jgi:hypothetical protein
MAFPVGLLPVAVVLLPVAFLLVLEAVQYLPVVP